MIPRPRARSTVLVTVVALLALILGSCAGQESSTRFGVVNPDRDGFAGTPVAMTLPDVTLTDTSGRPFDLRADTDAPVTLIFFGYTHCPDRCPITMATITLALGNLAAQQREKVEVLFITTDPRRDTPARLRAWLDRFDPRYEGLTGPMPKIAKVAGALGLALNGKTPPSSPASGAYDVGHGLQVYAIGPDDRTLLVWTGSPSISALTHDLQRML